MTGGPIKKRFTKKAVFHAIFWTVLIGGLITYVIWDAVTNGPVTQLFSDRDRLIKIVEDLGPFGPLLYILLQIAQTILAPIPANVVGGVGGFLFGWWGILWTTIGSCIGAAGVFYVSRRFGRKFAERVVKKSTLDKFDFIFGKRASFILFMIYLIPGLPDDIVCYVAGLTDVPIKKLILLFGLGRLPAVIVTNYVGQGLGEGDWTAVFIASAIAVVIFLVAYLKRESIMKWLKKGSKKARSKVRRQKSGQKSGKKARKNG